MMWMPFRASKMNGFILGFHRLVWCPKWTPESSSSLIPILITISLWLRVRAAFCERTIPRNTGFAFLRRLVLLWPPARIEQELWPLSPLLVLQVKLLNPPTRVKKLAEFCLVATFIYTLKSSLFV